MDKRRNKGRANFNEEKFKKMGKNENKQAQKERKAKHRETNKNNI